MKSKLPNRPKPAQISDFASKKSSQQDFVRSFATAKPQCDFLMNFCNILHFFAGNCMCYWIWRSTLRYLCWRRGFLQGFCRGFWSFDLRISWIGGRFCPYFRHGLFQNQGNFDYFLDFIVKFWFIFSNSFRRKHSFLNFEIVESSNSCLKFQFFTYSPFILRRQLRDPHFFQNSGHFQYNISWHQNKISWKWQQFRKKWGSCNSVNTLTDFNKLYFCYGNYEDVR